MTDRAVVLAAGRGTRMRKDVPGLNIDAHQRAMARRGLKALIPFHGHPFLAYALQALADAGVREVCLVVGPGDDPVRSAFEEIPTSRLRLSFAVQDEPRGAAHALLAAEWFAAGEHVLVVNADNLYPAPAVRMLLELNGSGFAGFRPESLLEGGIPIDRIGAYGVVQTDSDGFLTGIVEKPGADGARLVADGGWISMTCWCFGPAIFEACRRIEPSVRGELELPEAVGLAVRHFGERLRVVPATGAVLDLSVPEDIPIVSAQLTGRPAAL